MDIAFVAGEASGDRHGAALLAAMRDELRAENRPAGDQIEAWGIGGVLMEKAGVRLAFDSRSWGAIGIIESLALVPPLLAALGRIKKALRRRPPDALVLIDFGAFNGRLGEWAKKNAICPVFYYIPPGCWRRRISPKGLRQLTRLADVMITPFAWSEPQLRSAGIDASFLGHPLLDLVHTEMAPEDFDRRFGLDPHRAVIALLPGSRKQEIENILPTMLSAAGEIARRVPGAQFLLALAPNVAPEEVEEILRREQELGGAAGLLKLMRQASGEINRVGSALKAALTPSPKLATTEGLLLDSKAAHTEEEEDAPWTQHHKRPPAQSAPLVLVEGLTYDTMARADLVVATSGTATLEAAILHKPMIIVYRGSRLMEAEWRVRRRGLALDYIGLPNILAGRLVCPELIQEEASSKAIADHAVEMLLQPERLMHIKEKLASVVAENLGERGAIQRSAQLILDKLDGFKTSAKPN